MELSTIIEKENKELFLSGIEFFVINAKSKGRSLATAHIHSAIEILYISKGSFKIYIDNSEFFANEGELILCRSNSIHSVYSLINSPSQYYVLKLRPSFLLEFSDKNKGSLYLMQLSHINKNQKIIWTSDELKKHKMDLCLNSMISAYEKNSHSKELIIKANIILLISEILKLTVSDFESSFLEISSSTQHQIYQAMVYINKNFNKSISASECASHVHMSYTYFSRLFKSVLQKSFTRYLTEVRINHAEEEICTTDKSITEICFDCGFNDTSYFIKKFKELRGISPHQYRKDIKGHKSN